MITHYMHLTEMLLSSLNDTDKSNKIEDILNKPIIDSTVNTKNKKTYRDLLKGNFDINRVMRIERKDDLYTMGYAMEDFSARSMNQLLELGKHDALDKLIRSLCNMIEIIFYDDKTPPQVSDKNKTKNSLHKHLEKAKELLQRKENDYYQEIMNHLYDFADEISRMESDGELSQDNANLLRP